MSECFKPSDAAGVAEVVAWAAAENYPLEVVGGGSKRTLGRPVQAAHCLALGALSGVELYEPAELVLRVKAGTPMDEIFALLERENQELAFEPLDYGPLLRKSAETEGAGLDVVTGGTVGGMIGTNLAGPKRLKFGAARDHILGMEAVSGRGELFKSGGQVVKNVTGYDLPRALTGSWGTLAVATSITLKVMPKAEMEATFVLRGLSDAQGVESLCRAMGSSAEVASAAHLPGGGGAFGVDGLDGERPATLLRLEGFGQSVDYRFDILRRVLGEFGTAERLEAQASRSLWRGVRDCRPFWGSAAPVWRVSVAPNAGPAFVRALCEVAGADVFYDWSGGLVWAQMRGDDPMAEDVRAAVAKAGGGHATLVRASAAERSALAVFEPQAPALAQLTRRFKQQFDPSGILNPGRMVNGL